MEKVYKFDEKNFPKVYIPYLTLIFGISIFIFIIYSLVWYYIVSNHYMVISSPVLLLVFIIMLIYDFFKTRSLLYDSCIRINISETPLAVYDTYKISTERIFTVKKIDYIKNTRFYIFIKGEIELSTKFKDDIKPMLRIRKRIRIPAYFENMDEIYYELKKIKGNA